LRAGWTGAGRHHRRLLHAGLTPRHRMASAFAN
jgi:hypothetical protein